MNFDPKKGPKRAQNAFSHRFIPGRTREVCERSFSMFPSILSSDFDLILGSFFTFRGTNGLFLGLGKNLKTVFGSTHVVEQL